ncbi:YadA-like family protein [Sneathia sanguinegens]|uniref:YadA-like family protein n=1 Tax=Sneathia sanguinegens TaxID=40543 RepID=UPI00290A4E83|nr:YadA-like family protein [Sneathia sanguinegens]MDU7497238.1 YadA-like family protein [Sneathia sanguinegens]
MNIEVNLKKFKTTIKKKRKITLALMLSFLMTGTIGFAETPTVEELQRKIQELQNKIEQLEVKNKEIESKFNSENVLIGKGAVENGKGSIAIGEKANINNYVGQNGSIAIGQNAFAESMVGQQEKYFAFNNDIKYDKKFLFIEGNIPNDDPKNIAKLISGLAIGNNTYARSGGIMIGPHNFRGKMGDLENISTDTDEEKRKLGLGVLSTTLGTNSFTNGAFATTLGAYSIITSNYDGNNPKYVSQNFGALINGSLNSIESFKSDNAYSGIANSVVGVANRTNNSNGSLIFGAGNEITNSIENVNLSLKKFESPNDLSKELRKKVSDNKGGGATLAIGGGNKADYTKQVSMIGTRNEVKGTKDKKTELVSVSGDNNLVENSRNIVAGKNFHVKGEGNVLQGYNNIKNEKGFLQNEYDHAENIRKEKLKKAQDKVTKTKEKLDEATKENNTTNISIYKMQLTKDEKEVEKYNKETDRTPYNDKVKRNFVTNNNVVALGNDIEINTDNSVYLGTKSTETKEANTLWRSEKDKRDKAYGEYAGFEHIGGIVTVGNDTLTRVIQNVAPGLISATSTDAINGSQLYNYVAKQYITIKDGKGGETKVKLGDTLTLKGTTIDVTVKAPEPAQPTPVTPAPATPTETKAPEHTATFEAKGNVGGSDTFGYKYRDDKGKETELKEGPDGKLYTNDFIENNEYKNNKWVKKGTDTDSENISKNQYNKSDEKVILSTKYGKDGKVISNVSDGKNDNDAVNVKQLKEVEDKIKNISNNSIDEAKEKSNLALSGVANAIAIANLVQVNSYSDYRHNLTAAYGYYGKQHALAIGFSGVTENRRVGYKISGSVNTKGNLGLGVGVGVMLGEKSERKLYPEKSNLVKDLKEKVNMQNKQIEELKKENQEIKEMLKKIMEKK